MGRYLRYCHVCDRVKLIRLPRGVEVDLFSVYLRNSKLRFIRPTVLNPRPCTLQHWLWIFNLYLQINLLGKLTSKWIELCCCWDFFPLFVGPRSESCLLPIRPFRAAAIQLHCYVCSQWACVRVSLGVAGSPQARLLDVSPPHLGPTRLLLWLPPSLCVYPGQTPPPFQQVHMKFWSFNCPGDACVKTSHHHDMAREKQREAVSLLS